MSDKRETKHSAEKM